MEPCRRLQGARSTQVRLSQTSSALASPDLLPRSLTFEALHTTIPNVVREELALLGRPTTHMVQFTNDATIRATVPQEIDRAIYYLFLAQPPYDGISNEPSPSQPTSYVMAVGCMTEPVRYPQDQHFQNRPDVPPHACFHCGFLDISTIFAANDNGNFVCTGRASATVISRFTRTAPTTITLVLVHRISAPNASTTRSRRVPTPYAQSIVRGDLPVADLHLLIPDISRRPRRALLSVERRKHQWNTRNISGKPIDAVLGGPAGDTELTIVPPELMGNDALVRIGGLSTSALVDTVSCISVLSLFICKRLRKVLLPPQAPALWFAFNHISSPIHLRRLTSS